MTAEAREAIRDLRWWHSIEVAPGVVTPGPWDLRPTAERMPWPGSLRGLRCLDVGTMDGFWAFELERLEVEAVTGILRDRYGPPPPEEPIAFAARARYWTGFRGRSAAA